MGNINIEDLKDAATKDAMGIWVAIEEREKTNVNLHLTSCTSITRGLDSIGGIAIMLDQLREAGGELEPCVNIKHVERQLCVLETNEAIMTSKPSQPRKQ